MAADIQALRGRAKLIADRWCAAIAPEESAHEEPGLQHQVMELTGQLVAQLLAEVAEPNSFREIGRALADLNSADPDTLGRSLTFLSEQLMLDLSAQSRALIQPRLAVMIGEVAAGYFDQANKVVLREHEEIRSAHDLTHRRLEAAVHRSEEKYRTLVESANQAIFILDKSGVFRFMNGSSARQLGGQVSDFIGKTMWELFPANVARKQMANVLKALESGTPSLSEAETILQGQRHWRETSLQPLRDEEGEYAAILGISTDITERKRAESSLREYSERLRNLREIDRAILAAQSPQAIAQATLSHIRRLLPVWEGAVVLIEPEGTGLRVLAGQIGRFNAGTSYQTAEGVVAVESQKEEVILLDRGRITRRQSALLSMLGSEAGRALLVVPLIVQNELIGALMLTLDQPDAYTDQQVEVAREIAAPLAIAIQNAGLLEAERAAREENARLLEQIQLHASTLEEQVGERTRDLSALYAVTAVANQFLEVDSLLEKSLERVTEALGCHAAAVHLMSDEPQRLELKALASSWPDGADTRVLVEESERLARQVFQDNRPVLRTGSTKDLDPPDRENWRPPHASAGVPMRARGEILGALCVFCSARHEFSDSDITLLGSIADQVGGAVENARLRVKAEQGAVMHERDRLARELHDSVTQALYSLTLFAEAALDRTRNQQMNVVQEHLEEIELTAHQALKEMRLLLYELRSTPLVPEGLAEALRHRLDAVETRAGVQARLVTGSLESLPAPAEEGLYRIAQEALNNVLKHADASTVTVEFRVDPTCIIMEVSDDGRGFDRDAVLRRGGLGLSTMGERAESLGGALTIASQPGAGTRIEVRIERAKLGIEGE
jgi:PAS domain S-box-containing protein